MHDLAEQLRSVVDNAAAPVPIDAVTAPRTTTATRRNAWLLAVAVLAVVVGVAALLVSRGGDAPSKVHVTTPGPGLLPPRWSRLPATPLGSRSGHVMAWTGTQLLVWGGADEHAVRNDGAAFDVATGTWAPLPPSPLQPSSASLLGTWTGTELLVWDNDASDATHRTGAAYDPTTHTWRTIAPSPLPADQATSVVAWDGHEALLWSASAPTGTAEPVRTFFAGYDPVADRWQMLDPGPLDVNGVAGAWDGHELLLTGWLDNHPNGVFPAGGTRPAAAYDPAARTWRAIAAPVPSLQEPLTVAWDGHELLTVTYNLDWSSYDPSTDRWAPIASVPMQAGECGPQSATLGTTVFLYYCGAAAVFDVTNRVWTPIATPFAPHAPATPSTGYPPNTPLVAAGSAYVVYGAGGAAPNADAWSYNP